MSESGQRPKGGARLARKVALIALGLVVAVFVLFTWVFPWITEIGLSPALD